MGGFGPPQNFERREQLLYCDTPIFGPHYDVDVLLQVVKTGNAMEVRNEI